MGLELTPAGPGAGVKPQGAPGATCVWGGSRRGRARTPGLTAKLPPKFPRVCVNKKGRFSGALPGSPAGVGQDAPGGPEQPHAALSLLTGCGRSLTRSGSWENHTQVRNRVHGLPWVPGGCIHISQLS